MCALGYPRSELFSIYLAGLILGSWLAAQILNIMDYYPRFNIPRVGKCTFIVPGSYLVLFYVN